MGARDLDRQPHRLRAHVRLRQDAVRQQANDIYLVRTRGLLAAVFVMMAIGGLLTFAAWWLKTWRGERLRPALMFLTKGLPLFATMCLVAYLDHRFKAILALLGATSAVMASLALLVVTSAVALAICITWWHWVNPAIERAVARANIGRRGDCAWVGPRVS
jgi:hypothetical protein